MNTLNGGLGAADSMASMGGNAMAMDGVSSASRMGSMWMAQDQPTQKMTELAGALGVSATDVQAAFKAAFAQVVQAQGNSAGSGTSAVSGAAQSTSSSSSTSSASSTTGSAAAPSDFLTALSQQLGVSTTTLQNAFNTVGIGKSGQGGHHHHHHHGGGGASASSALDATAAQLGVQPQDLESAFMAAIENLTSSSSAQGSATQSSTGNQVLSSVAQQLGVSSSSLQQALQQNSASLLNVRT
jgi:AraC-like DNA-binding protein